MENKYYKNETVKSIMHDCSNIINNGKYQEFKDSFEILEIKKIMLRLEKKFNNFETQFKK